MIDAEQRALAQSIMKNGVLPEKVDTFHQKAVIYGMLAYLMADVNLEEIGNELKNLNLRTIYGNTERLKEILNSRIDGIAAGKSESINPLTVLIRKRWADLRLPYDYNRDTVERLKAGVFTAIEAEKLTMYTLQHRTQNLDQIITEAAVFKSQRVPFKLAMRHISSARINTDLNTECVWVDTFNGTRTKVSVLLPDVASLDTHHGLRLDVELPMEADKMSQEAAIGCPVTLVTGFIRSLHNIVAERAIRDQSVAVH